jgi:hypothetical protein
MSNIDFRRGGMLTSAPSPLPLPSFGIFESPFGLFESPFAPASLLSGTSASGSAISHPRAVMSVPTCSDESMRSARTRSTFKILPRSGKIA